jgi:hypothetical protein
MAVIVLISFLEIIYLANTGLFRFVEKELTKKNYRILSPKLPPLGHIQWRLWEYSINVVLKKYNLKNFQTRKLFELLQAQLMFCDWSLNFKFPSLQIDIF